MPIATKYVLIASMDVDTKYEELFNELYDEHAEFIRKVPGVQHVTRMKGEPFGIAIGGGVKAMPAPDPVYTAVYEIDDPKVLTGPEWEAACEAGRWAAEIRPHTRKRTHFIYKV